MDAPNREFALAGTLEELKAKGRLVVHGRKCFQEFLVRPNSDFSATMAHSRNVLWRAAKFSGLPVESNADPFTAVIRCTSSNGVENKTISKWARALRYVARCKEPVARFRTFMKEAGGVNACADRHAKYLGRIR
jgi:hypothetical protein